MPSGIRPTITLLHDCEHPSALRFLMPTPGAALLDVREADEGTLSAPEGVQRLEDGGGTATASLCGSEPERLPIFGPEQAAG